MLVALEEHSLELQTWSDKSTLRQCLNRCDGGWLILGDDAEQELEFYSAIVYFNYAAQSQNSRVAAIKSWGIGLISEGHGLKPQLVALPNGTLVFGLNHEVIGISLEFQSIVFRHRFDTLFHAFLYLARHRLLVVRNEIGVVALTENGHELWRYEKDIVTNCLVDEAQIILHFMDTTPTIIDLSTGRAIEGLESV